MSGKPDFQVGWSALGGFLQDMQLGRMDWGLPCAGAIRGHNGQWRATGESVTIHGSRRYMNPFSPVGPAGSFKCP